MKTYLDSSCKCSILHPNSNQTTTRVDVLSSELETGLWNLMNEENREREKKWKLGLGLNVGRNQIFFFFFSEEILRKKLDSQIL